MFDESSLDAAFAELEHELTDVARGLTVRIFNGVLSRTPQYHGRMTASWSYSIGAPVYEDRSAKVQFEGPRKTQFHDWKPSQGLYRGHPAAIAVANAANAQKDRAFKLGDTVWIANGVNHGEGPYSMDVEEGNIQLRPHNLPGQPVARTLDWVQANFGTDIKKPRAAALRALTIGASNADPNP